MINQETLNQLREMRLTAMAADIRERCSQPAFLEMNFGEQMNVIVDREWHRRKEKNVREHVRQASFCYSHASAADIDYAPERGLDRKKINELDQCDYILNGSNVIIMGATGVGKTYLACALGNSACRSRYTCRYVRMPNLTDELGLAKDSGPFQKIIQQYTKPRLLILDEWLLNPLDENGVSNVFELMESRYSDRKSTIFCTQIDVPEWLSLLGNNLMAESIMDRIIHNAVKILLNGDSMRKRRSPGC